jgi:hypothetical protein
MVYIFLGEMSPGTRYIIQVDRPGEPVDMASLRALLDGVGVTLDADYGPVPVNPKLGRYVVRGTASPDARARAEQIPGVRFFSDAVQEPAP